MRKVLSLMISMLAVCISLPSYAEDNVDKPTFTLTTTSVLDEGGFPVLYTCDGKDLQPQFTWTNVPANTQTFAMLFTDKEAPNGTFYHWVLFNIPKNTKELPEGMKKLPAGAVLGKNSFNKDRYNGPCPPRGTAHTYVFTLYALDTKLNLPKGADGERVFDAMKDHILDKATLTTTYSRWIQ